ncbi:hypothetical protein [Deinococcus depolymerans]|uniref:Uncharacterized protein n=1 Tax=Deinococcus depolymerans TaxID=392408 RepID=A0ABP3LT30_9DEIO
MTQFPPDPEASGPSRRPLLRLTAAFSAPQDAAELRGALLGRLDARLLHLHARLPAATLRAVLHDSARLLGAHLNLRGETLDLRADPWSGGGDLRGETLAAARHHLMLPGTPRRLDGPALRTLTDRWPRGTLLLVEGGVVGEQLNLADELDRLTLQDALRDWTARPGPAARVHVHRLLPGGRLEQWLAPRGW